MKGAILRTLFLTQLTVDPGHDGFGHDGFAVTGWRRYILLAIQDGRSFFNGGGDGGDGDDDGSLRDGHLLRCRGRWIWVVGIGCLGSWIRRRPQFLPELCKCSQALPPRGRTRY